MKSRFDEQLQNAQSLSEVRDKVIALLQELRKEQKQLAYVAGTIFSDGAEFVQRNISRLDDLTDKLRAKNKFPIFSSVDIFYGGLFDRLPESKLQYIERRKLFIQFWRDIIGCGYITDIYMAPGWEKSEGATDEHTTATNKGITIHYISVT